MRFWQKKDQNCKKPQHSHGSVVSGQWSVVSGQGSVQGVFILGGKL
ncbi:MAG: hypothetical protein ACKPGU_03235 [Dolichospermum sp.]